MIDVNDITMETIFGARHTLTVNRCRMIDINDITMEIISLVAINEQ
jgi:hypothetical protein